MKTLKSHKMRPPHDTNSNLHITHNETFAEHIMKASHNTNKTITQQQIKTNEGLFLEFIV